MRRQILGDFSSVWISRKPKPGDELVADDHKTYRVMRVVGIDRDADARSRRHRAASQLHRRQQAAQAPLRDLGGPVRIAQLPQEDSELVAP